MIITAFSGLNARSVIIKLELMTILSSLSKLSNSFKFSDYF